MMSRRSLSFLCQSIFLWEVRDTVFQEGRVMCFNIKIGIFFLFIFMTFGKDHKVILFSLHSYNDSEKGQVSWQFYVPSISMKLEIRWLGSSRLLSANNWTKTQPNCRVTQLCIEHLYPVQSVRFKFNTAIMMMYSLAANLPICK